MDVKAFYEEHEYRLSMDIVHRDVSSDGLDTFGILQGPESKRGLADYYLYGGLMEIRASVMMSGEPETDEEEDEKVVCTVTAYHARRCHRNDIATLCDMHSADLYEAYRVVYGVDIVDVWHMGADPEKLSAPVVDLVDYEDADMLYIYDVTLEREFQEVNLDMLAVQRLLQSFEAPMYTVVLMNPELINRTTRCDDHDKAPTGEEVAAERDRVTSERLRWRRLGFRSIKGTEYMALPIERPRPCDHHVVGTRLYAALTREEKSDEKTYLKSLDSMPAPAPIQDHTALARMLANRTSDRPTQRKAVELAEDAAG